MHNTETHLPDSFASLLTEQKDNPWIAIQINILNFIQSLCSAMGEL